MKTEAVFILLSEDTFPTAILIKLQQGSLSLQLIPIA